MVAECSNLATSDRSVVRLDGCGARGLGLLPEQRAGHARGRAFAGNRHEDHDRCAEAHAEQQHEPHEIAAIAFHRELFEVRHSVVSRALRAAMMHVGESSGKQSCVWGGAGVEIAHPTAQSGAED